MSTYVDRVESSLQARFSAQLERVLNDTVGTARLMSGIQDETYRKAGKLDEAAFSTNFHPADAGILDAVAQTLLPMIGNCQAALRGVQAELYKLSKCQP